MLGARRRRSQLWHEIRRVARDDLERVAEELAALESEHENDAYYRAVGLHHEASERLVTARTVQDARAVARLAGLARREIGAARGAAPAAGLGPCFFDPAHGPSAREVLFAPEGAALRAVEACDACAEEVDAGRLPPLRRVLVDGRPQPYWRSPAHVGYAGRGGGASLDDLLGAARGGPGLGLGAGGALGFGLLELLLDSWS